ncbi:MAG: hypothetical protein HOH33_07335 [Verrucomicrobia bacterium]|jgi:hypothetical protein|nr:hypothetical protein [Verrucomicrobiota bacterium]
MSAAQTKPTYKTATGKAEAPIVDTLIKKYGYKNICWPIVFSKKSKSVAYIYERNKTNLINNQNDVRPASKSGIPTHFLDYTCCPRVSSGTAISKDIISERFSCSYEFVIESDFSSVDLDYVWKTKDGFRGFELTTFYVPFGTKENAARLVSMMNRRPSWKGVNGAHALHKIATSAEDLSIKYYIVCVNTVGKVGSEIATDGDVFLFRLTNTNIERISSGQVPLQSSFMPFNVFCNRV